MGAWCICRGAEATSGPLPTSAEMVAALRSHDGRDLRVREWLLLLLRFAVTREPSDRCAALAMADELDSLGARWRPAGPTFFLRTSNEVCEAIPTANDRHGYAVLRKHAARMDEPRLRRAFEAAVGIQQASEPQQQGTTGKRRTDRDLWKGLPIR